MLILAILFPIIFSESIRVNNISLRRTYIFLTINRPIPNSIIMLGSRTLFFWLIPFPVPWILIRFPETKLHNHKKTLWYESNPGPIFFKVYFSKMCELVLSWNHSSMYPTALIFYMSMICFYWAGGHYYHLMPIFICSTCIPPCKT